MGDYLRVGQEYMMQNFRQLAKWFVVSMLNILAHLEL